MKSDFMIFLSVWLLKLILFAGADPVKELPYKSSVETISIQFGELSAFDLNENYEELKQFSPTIKNVIEDLLSNPKNELVDEKNQEIQEKDNIDNPQQPLIRVLNIRNQSEHELNNLAETIYQLQGQIDANKEVINAKNEEILRKNIQIENLTQNITELQMEIEVKNLNSSKESEIPKNIEEEVYNTTENNLQGQICVNKEVIYAKNDEIQEQNIRIDTLTQNITELQREIKSNDVRMSEFRDKVLTLINLESEVEGMNASFDDLAHYIDIFKKEMNMKDEEIDRLRKLIQEDNIKMEVFRRNLSELEKHNEERTWLTIQKRFDGSENFDRNWADYKNGFGDVNGEFFYGLESIYTMTKSRQYELMIKLEMINGSTGYAHYDNFKIGNEKESYELKSLGKFSGDAGDSLLNSGLHLKFSTKNKDNDGSSVNCAKLHGGGWWYKHCTKCMLNGKFYKDGRRNNIDETYGIHWGTFQNNNWTISLTFTEMMIRPKSDKPRIA